MSNANSTVFWWVISLCLLVMMRGSIWDVNEMLFLWNFQLSSGFIVAEATVRNDIMFSELFYDCKGYVISTCKGDLCNASIDDLCQVFFCILWFTFQFSTILKWFITYLGIPQALPFWTRKYSHLKLENLLKWFVMT